MYFLRDLREDDLFDSPRVTVRAAAWADFFGISSAVHPDKRSAFTCELEKRFTRIAAADTAAATIASFYKAGKFHNPVVEEMLELCSDILANHKFIWTPFDELKDKLFGVKNVITAVLGCQNKTVLKRRAIAAVSFCADAEKAIHLALSGLRPPRGEMQVGDEYRKLREYVDDELNKRRADIRSAPHFSQTVGQLSIHTCDSKARQIDTNNHINSAPT